MIDSTSAMRSGVADRLDCPTTVWDSPDLNAELVALVVKTELMPALDSPIRNALDDVELSADSDPLASLTRSAFVTTLDNVSTIDSAKATRSLVADALTDPVIVCDASVLTAMDELDVDALELTDADDSLNRIADDVTEDCAPSSADAPSTTS